jgi:hypothetical protein
MDSACLSTEANCWNSSHQQSSQFPPSRIKTLIFSAGLELIFVLLGITAAAAAASVAAPLHRPAGLLVRNLCPAQLARRSARNIAALVRWLVTIRLTRAPSWGCLRFARCRATVPGIHRYPYACAFAHLWVCGPELLQSHIQSCLPLLLESRLLTFRTGRGCIACTCWR